MLPECHFFWRGTVESLTAMQNAIISNRYLQPHHQIRQYDILEAYIQGSCLVFGKDISRGGV